MENLNINLGIVGAGNMGGAIAGGLSSSNLINCKNIYMYDINAEKSSSVALKYKINNVSLQILFKECKLIIIAVKPDAAGNLLSDIKNLLVPEHIVVSIVAGLSIKTIQNFIGNDKKIIRVMPNTPALVGESMSAVCGGDSAKDDDIDIVIRIFSCIGRAVKVNESKMNAVTGISGSSPAFIFQIIEAMSDAGVMAGLSREQSTLMAAQSVYGAAKMVLETGIHPAALKDMVTSPSGTTIAGVYKMEKHGVRAAMIDAITSAVLRSEELSKN